MVGEDEERVGEDEERVGGVDEGKMTNLKISKSPENPFPSRER